MHTDLKKQLIHYCVGACGAMLLTLLAFVLVVLEVFSLGLTATIILALAGVQAVVQVFYFLHIGEETKPHWKSISLIFTAGTALLIVVASLWIMVNLNYNMGMSGEEMNHYMLEQNKKGF